MSQQALLQRFDIYCDVGKLGHGQAGGVSAAGSGLAGLMSGALLVYFHTEPRYSFAVADPSNALTIALLLGIAMAIAVLVDAAASRAREARRASQEAELLSLFAASLALPAYKSDPSTSRVRRVMLRTLPGDGRRSNSTQEIVVKMENFSGIHADWIWSGADPLVGGQVARFRLAFDSCSRATWAARQLISLTWWSSPKRASRTRFAPKLFVSITCAPASAYSR